MKSPKNTRVRKIKISIYNRMESLYAVNLYKGWEDMTYSEKAKDINFRMNYVLGNSKLWTEEEHVYYYNTMLELLTLSFKYDKYKTDDTLTETRKLTSYMFLTICPPDDTPIGIFLTLIQKYLKRTNILRYIYVIEQRAETQDQLGKGLHCHILIYHKYDRYASLKRDFHNSFKSIIDTDHPNAYKWLNIKHNNTDQDALKRIEYMIGEKKDEVKHKKQEMDKIYRHRFNLEPFYEKNNFINILKDNQ